MHRYCNTVKSLRSI